IRVQLVYQNYFQRRASDGEVAVWLRVLQQPAPGPGRPAPSEQFLAAVLASREYFQRYAGTDRNWLQGMYTGLLQRQPDPAGFNANFQALVNGYAPAQQAVTAAILSSSEYRARLLRGYYQTYLHRAAGQAGEAELRGWVAFLARGGQPEQVVAAFLGSSEYAQTHASNTAWLDGVFQDVLGRGRDPGSQGLLDALGRGASRTQVAAVV